MDSAGGIANENIILHARAARLVIDSLNSTAAVVDDFHGPLGIRSTRDSLNVTPWREALSDPEQRSRASKEAGRKALVGIAVAGAVVVPLILKNGPKPSA